MSPQIRKFYEGKTLGTGARWGVVYSIFVRVFVRIGTKQRGEK
jgi:hypothetical protein